MQHAITHRFYLLLEIAFELLDLLVDVVLEAIRHRGHRLRLLLPSLISTPRHFLFYQPIEFRIFAGCGGTTHGVLQLRRAPIVLTCRRSRAKAGKRAKLRRGGGRVKEEDEF